jgi:hypothetical protein
MEIPVLIERRAGNGFQARTSGPLEVTAEGETQDEVLAKVRASIQERLAGGAVVVALHLPIQPHPWAKFAGSWKVDDPLLEEWRQAVEEYRRRVDEDPDAP